MSHDDFEIEPIPGLPAKLPKGEHIVWQGKPDRGTFARVVLHERKIVLYFLLLIGWKFGTGIYDGETFLQSLYTASTLALGAFIVIGLMQQCLIQMLIHSYLMAKRQHGRLLEVLVRVTN